MSGDSLRHSPRVAWVGEEGRVVVLHLDRLEELPVVLSGSGAAIWHAVDGSSDADEVVLTVADEFGLPTEAVAADVRAFLDDLATRGLITTEKQDGDG
jgi:hypothetical protein